MTQSKRIIFVKSHDFLVVFYINNLFLFMFYFFEKFAMVDIAYVAFFTG